MEAIRIPVIISRGGRSKGNHRLGRHQEKSVSAAARKEPDPLGDLSFVSLEAQGLRSEGSLNRGRIAGRTPL
jgi:hypothetical protein